MKKVMYDPSRLNTIFLSASEAEGIHPGGSSQLVLPSVIGAHRLQQGKPCLRPNLQREIMHEGPEQIPTRKKQY